MARTATTRHVAEALGVKPTTVQLYSRQRRIPFSLTPGGQRRYDLDEVLAAIEAAPSAVTAIAEPGIGEGLRVDRAPMASFDAERRAVVGEMLEPSDHSAPARHSAALELIDHSRRVLLAI